jgi:hypothetical protein
MKLSDSGTVEELLSRVEMIVEDQNSFELWVSHRLSWKNQPVASDVAMAIVLDALLAKGFFPNGFEEGVGGSHYKYQLE